LHIDNRTWLTIRRDNKRLSTRVRLIRNMRSVIFPREIFEARFDPNILWVGESVILFPGACLRNGIALPRRLFERIKRMARRWLWELSESTRAQRVLESEYLTGQFRDYVFCLSTGKHWSLAKYISTLLLPLTLNNFMKYAEEPGGDIAEAVFTLTASQISTMQDRFAHFDYTVSTDWLLQLIHTSPALKNELSDLIDNLDVSEMSDLLHLNSVVFYAVPSHANPPSNLRQVAARCRRLRPSHSSERWHYIEFANGDHFVDDGSFGWILVEGRAQLLNQQFGGFDWKFPDRVIRNYLSADYRVTRTSVVEICVFSCYRFCQLIVRHGGRVIAISPLMGLSRVLQHLSGEHIILDRSSPLCRCARCASITTELSESHSSLQCLAAKAYKENHTRINSRQLALLPKAIKRDFFAWCSVDPQTFNDEPRI